MENNFITPSASHAQGVISSKAGFPLYVIMKVCLCVSYQSSASPWLHHASAGSGDGLALLSHVPVRPASADVHRSSMKMMSTHTSPPISRTNADLHKESVI